MKPAHIWTDDNKFLCRGTGGTMDASYTGDLRFESSSCQFLCRGADIII